MTDGRIAIRHIQAFGNLPIRPKRDEGPHINWEYGAMDVCFLSDIIRDGPSSSQSIWTRFFAISKVCSCHNPLVPSQGLSLPAKDQPPHP